MIDPYGQKCKPLSACVSERTSVGQSGKYITCELTILSIGVATFPTSSPFKQRVVLPLILYRRTKA